MNALSSASASGSLAVGAVVASLAATFLAAPARRRDAHGHRALPASGQRLQGHRRPGPRRQRRPGDRRDPRGQLGPGRDAVRRRVRAPGRRQGRHRHADAGRRPVRAAHPGVHRGHADGRRRRHRRCPTPACRSSWTGSTPASATCPRRSAPNGVNKDGTLDHAARGRREGAGRPGPARQRDDPQPVARGLRRSARAAATALRDRHAAGAVHRGARPPTTGWCGPSSRTWPASPARWPASGSSSSARSRRWRARSAPCATFVHGNRAALVTDVEKLTRVMKTINSERGSIDDALQVAPLALGNLAVAFNNQTGSIGSRIGVNGTFGDLDGFLCVDRHAVRDAAGQQGPRLQDLQADLSRSRTRPASSRPRDGSRRP